MLHQIAYAVMFLENRLVIHRPFLERHLFIKFPEPLNFRFHRDGTHSHDANNRVPLFDLSLKMSCIVLVSFFLEQSLFF